MTLKELFELEDEFYGKETEDGDEEGGVIEDNYALADWSRAAVPDLFNAIRELLKVGEDE